jgi:hypothetical protein
VIEWMTYAAFFALPIFAAWITRPKKQAGNKERRD